MKIKSKTNFQVRCSFMKLFSQNLQIQAPFCEVIISKLGQRDSNCVSCTTEVKISKSGHIIALVHSKNFFWQNFWILKHWSLLWNHYSTLYNSPYRTGFDLSTTNCIWYISLVLFWDHFNLFVTFCIRYSNLVFFDPILTIMTSELGLR